MTLRFRNLLLPHYHVFSPCLTKRAPAPLPAVVALCERPHGPSNGVLIVSTSATSPPPSATTANIVDRHHPCRPPRHPNDGPSPIDAPPLIEGCGHPNSPKTPSPRRRRRRRHIVGPRHRLNATSAKRRERGGGSGAT